VPSLGWPAGIVITGAALGLVVWLRERSARPRTPTARDLSAKLENIDSMTGGQFEIFIAEVLRALGHQATVLGGSGDQGVDIIAVMGNRSVAIQCKNYKKPVGNRPVQEVFAGARHHGCQQGWVVAPAGFTQGAIELAQSVGVLLCNADSIQTWIQRADQSTLEQEQRPGQAAHRYWTMG
jgi:restriction system protein